MSSQAILHGAYKLVGAMLNAHPDAVIAHELVISGLIAQGIKRAGAVSREIANDAGFLFRVRSLVGVPLRLVHVIPNHFDNIAAIAIADGRALEEAAQFYFSHCASTARLDTGCTRDEVVELHHEQMFQQPEQVLIRLCRFLSLDAEPEYLAACKSIIFTAPTYTRRKVDWPCQLVCETEARIREIPFLEHYSFDDDR